jgi:hypothetical protein
MRARSVLCWLLALGVGGCERYPEEPIFAYGEVLHADGSPRPGLTLSLERAEAPLNGPLERPSVSFAPYTTATTGPDGRFTLELLAGDAQYFERAEGPFGVRFRLTAPLEEGQGAFLSFEQDDDVELPTLRPWDSKLASVEGAGGPMLTFSPPPPAPVLPPAADVPSLINLDGTEVPMLPLEPAAVLQVHQGNQLIWQQREATSPWAPTPWMLEDFASPEVQLRAMSTGSWGFEPLGASSGYVDFRVEWRSERLPWPAGALRPVSRGAECRPAIASPCPWTDGLLTPTLMEGGMETFPEEVGVTLEAPTRLSRIVLRGMGVSPWSDFKEKDLVVFEGSLDGTVWTRLATVAPFHEDRLLGYHFRNESWNSDSPFDPPLRSHQRYQFLDVPVVDAPQVRHVRVFVFLQESGRRLPVRELAELSLFE